MTSSFFRSSLVALCLVPATFFTVLSVVIYLGYLGRSQGGDGFFAGLAGPSLSFGLLGYSVVGLMYRSFLESKRVPYLLDGSLFPSESFAEFCKRGKGGEVRKEFYHPFFRNKVFPLKGKDYFFVQLLFLPTFAILALV